MTTHFNDVVVENNLQTQNLTTNDIITTTLLVNNKDVSTTINNLNNIYQDAGDPTGFPVRTTSTISFDDSTRTFTIAPVGSTFEYYIKGTKISISSRSIVIPNVTGPYFIYLDDAGVLAYVTAFDISLLKGYAYVANVYWSATQSKSLGLAEERHGISMDWATHANLHLYTGARIQQNTFAIGNFNISGIGDNDNEVQASFGNGVITDEDINLTIINSATPTNPFEQVLSTVAELPIMYKTSTGEWVMDDPSNVLVKQGSSRIQYNQFSTGTWSTVDASDTYFVAMWVFVTNYQESPIRLFLGQRQDATLLDARTNNTYEEFNNSGLAIQEFKVIYRLIFQTDNSFTNSVKAKLVEILDVRKVIEQGQLVSSVNNHGQLSGLDQDHHQQYLNVTRADARFYTQSQIDGFLLNKITNSGNMISYSAGLNVSKPVAGSLGRNYYATDQGITYYDNGTTWNAKLPAYIGDVTSALGGTELTLATVNSNVGTFNNVTVNGKGLVTAASNVAYLTGNQTITLSGDLTGSGTTSISGTLANVNANVGTFNNITINAKGLATAGSNVAYLTGNQTITLSGDITGSGTTGITGTLATVNSNVGTFNNVTINAKGLATAGSNANYLQDPSANGIVVRTSLNTTINRLINGTTNQISITNGDGVSANPTVSIANDPIIPGTGAITIPIGTTAQRPVISNGQFRFNSDTLIEEIAESGVWRPVGRLLKFVTGNITQTTGTTIIPYDNTLPTSTEGFQIWTASITPSYANSTIIIMYNIFYECSANNVVVTTTLLNNTDAIAASSSRQATSKQPDTVNVTKAFTSGTTSTITLSARIGPATASTVYVNRGNTETFGGTIATSYIIMEVY